MKESRIFYLFLLGFSWLFIWLYGGKVPYTFFYVILLMPVVSALHAGMVYLWFKYRQQVSSKFVMKGDTVEYELEINNEDFFLYPYLTIHFSGIDTYYGGQFQSQRFSLEPYSRKKWCFPIECKYRGYYELGLKRVEICDVLGLFTFRYNVFEPIFITVYPKTVRLDRFRLVSRLISERNSLLYNMQEDRINISYIRDYLYGDKLNNIHWKLTAKTGKLKVKTYESTSRDDVVLLLDLKKNHYAVEQNVALEDKVIEGAIAVAHYCIRNWIPVRLLYYQEGIAEINVKSPVDFEDFYKLLATVKFNGDTDLNNIIEIFLGTHPDKTNVVIVTSNMSYDIYGQINNMKLSGFEVSLLYIYPEDISLIDIEEVDRILSKLPEIRVDTYKVCVNDDIKSILER